MFPLLTWFLLCLFGFTLNELDQVTQTTHVVSVSLATNCTYPLGRDVLFDCVPAVCETLSRD